MRDEPESYRQAFRGPDTWAPTREAFNTLAEKYGHELVEDKFKKQLLRAV